MKVIEFINKVKNLIPENLENNYESQIEMEKIRFTRNIEYNKNIRKFAANVTRKFINKEKLDLVKYTDLQFLTQVLLYYNISLIVTKLKLTAQPRLYIDSLCRKITNEFILQYLKKKKIKKQTWLNLSIQEQTKIIDDFLSNVWYNLEVNMDIIYLEKNKYYLNQNKDLDYLDDMIEYKFLDFPCLIPPKPWAINSSGGYYNINTNFIRIKNTFCGTTKPKKLLFDLINNLQNIPWSIDVSINNIFDDIKIKNKLTHFTQEEIFNIELSNNDRQDDLYQDLTTYIFIQNIIKNNKEKKIFLAYNIDFRGRLYPLSSWGFSPTSSKLMRKYIRHSEYLDFNKDTSKWLILKLTKLLNISINDCRNYTKLHNKAKDLLLNVREEQDFISLTKQLDVNLYNVYTAKKLLEDLEIKKTNTLIQLDATASAFQIIGIITNSEKLMNLTNLSTDWAYFNLDFLFQDKLSTYVYQDIYQYIIDIIIKRNDLPDNSMKIFLNRKLIKNLIMPIPYGKTQTSSIKDLLDFIKENKEYLHIPDNVEDSKIYNYLKTDISKKNWKDLVFTETNELKKENKKRFYFCSIFYTYLINIFYDEFPEIKKFNELVENLIDTKPFFNSKFYSFTPSYFKTKTYIKSIGFLKKRKRYSMRLILEEKNREKNKQGARANFIHGYDAFIIHYILDKLINKVNIYPIHDCLIIHPNDAHLVLTTVNEAYKEVQKEVSKMEVFKDFFENKELVDINNKYILKLEN